MPKPRIQGVPDLGPGLRLHLNENTAGCSTKVVEAVRRFDARGLATYPDYRAAVLETAASLGVDPEWVVLTNGLDEGVLLTAIGYLGPVATDSSREVIMAMPAFETYLTTAKAMGARIVAVPLVTATRFRSTGARRGHTQHPRDLHQQSQQSYGSAGCKGRDSSHRAPREPRTDFSGRGAPRLSRRDVSRRSAVVSQRARGADVFEGTASPGCASA